MRHTPVSTDPERASRALSSRGAAAASTPLRIDLEAHRAAVDNAFHPIENPDGALALNIAENRLGWPRLKSKLEAISADREIPLWVPSYTAARGAPDFRAALARFMGERVTETPMDPEHLGVSSGATGIIEMTAFLVAEAGDVAVIPAPAYPVYRADLGNLSGVERFDLVTHHDVSDLRSGPPLTPTHLDRAWEELAAAGKRFRMLILTSPDNPTGGVFGEASLREITEWCLKRGVHLVVNEIYALSRIDTGHPELERDYVDVEPWVSFGQLMGEYQSDLLHLWYALSKDLGISGFRVGVLYSLNDELMQAFENVNLTHSVSNHTQWLLQLLLSDHAFMGAYIEENARQLTEAYATVVRALRSLSVPYAPSRGSHFAWIDLSEFLDDDSEAGELRLWAELFRTSGVLFTPGVGFGHSKRGMFRVVFPCVAPLELKVAMGRLSDFVHAKRSAMRGSR